MYQYNDVEWGKWENDGDFTNVIVEGKVVYDSAENKQEDCARTQYIQ